jgi:L,D-peptidoglycan transpeptidase YkuD (ErfK/YbiS/YcfS/YnhG family)
MSIRVKKNYLIFDGTKFRCAIGKNGFIKEKCEGDGCSPIGTYKIDKVFYRKDRIKDICTDIETIEINPKDGWCDDQTQQQYNKLIQFPYSYSAEHLYRDDDIYNIICVLNHNQNPIVSGLGSAIFIHVASHSFTPTEGCIALRQSDLLNILSKITSNTEIVFGD